MGLDSFYWFCLLQMQMYENNIEPGTVILGNNPDVLRHQHIINHTILFSPHNWYLCAGMFMLLPADYSPNSYWPIDLCILFGDKGEGSKILKIS